MGRRDRGERSWIGIAWVVKQVGLPSQSPTRSRSIIRTEAEWSALSIARKSEDNSSGGAWPISRVAPQLAHCLNGNPKPTTDEEVGRTRLGPTTEVRTRKTVLTING